MRASRMVGLRTRQKSWRRLSLRDSRVVADVSMFSFFAVLFGHDVRVKNSITHGGGHGFQFADTLLDTSVDEALTFVDDLVSVETCWYDGGDDPSLETRRKLLGVYVGRTFDVKGVCRHCKDKFQS
jgi:hypothetical protein